MKDRVLTGCGALSALLYVAMNLIAPLEYAGYNPLTQTVSELSAIGAPTRGFWVWMALVYAALALAFGWGVLRVAGTSGRLRIVGWLLITSAALGLFWPPMHQRAVLAAGGGTASDVLHLVFSAITVALFFMTVGFGAGTFGRRFQRYSIATMVLMLGLGILVAIDGPRIGKNLPTPWVGLWERLDIGVYLAWIVVLSVTLRRVPPTGTGDRRKQPVAVATPVRAPATPAPAP